MGGKEHVGRSPQPFRVPSLTAPWGHDGQVTLALRPNFTPPRLFLPHRDLPVWLGCVCVAFAPVWQGWRIHPRR